MDFLLHNITNITLPYSLNDTDSNNNIQNISDGENTLKAILNSVQIIPIKNITIINKTAPIPISIKNSLDEPVNINIRITSTSYKINSDVVKSLTIPKNTNGTVTIPINVKGSGTANMSILIVNQFNQTIDKDTNLVHIKTDFQNKGTLIVICVLSLLFIVSIIRIIYLRNKKSKKVKKD
jgi:hypothetical protein